MQATEQTLETVDNTRAGGVPRVLQVRGGSTTERAISIVVPDEMRDATYNELVRLAIEMGANDRRSLQRVSSRIRFEMSRPYSITAEGARVQAEERVPVTMYRAKTTPSGRSYQGLDIVVASRQEGGSSF